MNELARMTAAEAAEGLSLAGLAVLPVGAIEQHGPHLPLDTDSAVAVELARRVATELGDAAVLCPPLVYGLSEHHLGFAGTMTLRPATFLSLVGDVLESLNHHGMERVLIVNGHGGNIEALRLAARTARRDRGMMVASVMWSVLAGDVVRRLASSEAYGHACEIETSVVAALFDDRVRFDRMDRPAPRRSVDPLTDPPGGIVDEPVWLHEWSADGALGDPASADPSHGLEIVEAFVERAVAYARRMIDRTPGTDQ